MRVSLAYGRDGLVVDLPDGDVIEPVEQPPLPDELAALRRAVRPVRELAGRGASVGISVCDVTRPFPAARVLPVLLEQLEAARVTVFVATGTHRLCTQDELERMLGPDVLRACRVVQHDAFDRSRHASLGPIGETGAEALVEGEFLEQEVRITTGFIEPHFFAGFSGGPKMVAPGLGALETVLELHSAARIGHPRAVWGVTRGNPVHDAVREIAARAGISFNLDLTLNREHAITGIFAGDLARSHAEGCEFARRTAMVPVSRPYDVVVTTNSGYPLDQNLYQAVKGMSAAAQVVRLGGAIVAASECSDGLPEHGRYRHLLAEAGGPEEFLARLQEPGFSSHDQWQVQVQAQIQRRARVLVHADGVPERQLREAWFEPAPDLERVTRELLAAAGPQATLAVLPQGPQTIPYLA